MDKAIAAAKAQVAKSPGNPVFYNLLGNALFQLKGLPNVLDIRCVGLTGAIDMAPIAGSPGLRGWNAIEYSFHEAGIMLRLSGDCIELTPPLIISEDQIGEIVDKVGRTIKAVA